MIYDNGDYYCRLWNIDDEMLKFCNFHNNFIESVKISKNVNLAALMNTICKMQSLLPHDPYKTCLLVFTEGIILTTCQYKIFLRSIIEQFSEKETAV